MSVKRLIVIEPHGDDALLSGSSVIELALKSGIPVELYTIGHSRSSEGMKKYWNLSKYKYYDLPEIDYSLRPKVNTHEVHKLYLQGRLPSKYVENYIMTNEKVSEVYDKVYGTTEKVIKEILSDLNEDDILLSPYGVDHPYHILVARIINDINPSCRSILYLEKPYFSKRYIRESIPDGLFIFFHEVSIKRPDTKEEVFVSIYPTEKSMFRFSKDALISEPEEYILDWREESLESLVCN